MSNADVIARVQALLGPRQIDCFGIATGGSNHPVQRDDMNLASVAEGKKPLYGVVWIDDEEKRLSQLNDFVWFFDFMPINVGKLEDRPPELQGLPAKITIYSHDPARLFNSLVGELFTLWAHEGRFKTAQKWYDPGKYMKTK